MPWWPVLKGPCLFYSLSHAEVTIKALKEKLEQYERSLQAKNTEEPAGEMQDRTMGEDGGERNSEGKNLPNNYADMERLAWPVHFTLSTLHKSHNALVMYWIYRLF